MDKREFIKNACKIGAYSCTIPFLNHEVSEAQTDDDECKKVKEMN